VLLNTLKVDNLANYPFSPAISKGRNPAFTWWEDAFTAEEIEQVKEAVNLLSSKPATIGQNNGDDVAPESIRKTKISWLKLTPDTAWIYEKMSYVAKELNAQYYNFDLYGFCEDMQATLYDETESHYTWHVDGGDNSDAPRKLSMVLQLSDPSEYEGGELQIFTKPEPEAVNKQKGLIVAFPAYTLHRVTPVTKGLRHSLVVWACGPAFK
jgi:PKHD-type hydroxylase